MKEINMNELFQTLPELPKEFVNWCYLFLPRIAIYYQRKGKVAECQCGKCGMHYVVEGKPSRNEPAICPHCKNDGFYEWKKVTNGRFFQRSFFILQCTTDNNLACRYFELEQYFEQGRSARIELIERKRWFMTLGDVYTFNHENRWGSNRWTLCWQAGKGHGVIHDGEMYPGWKQEIEKSNLKYCDMDLIQRITRRAKLNILIAFANNPAMEMYAKAGMKHLVDHLITKGGKTKWINRRGKNIKQQLRLKDKQKIKRFIENEGSMDLLEILLVEEKTHTNYTPEQEQFLIRRFRGYYNERKQTEYLLKFMSLQQLMNRIEKYKKQTGYYTEGDTIRRYYDYLQMREELGYDMTNEVYLYPKNLKEKHDEMVAEKRARQDELYVSKKMQQFPDIAKKYKRFCEKYSYFSQGYIIRPAKDAAEIIMEGRILHHCVGGDNYLRKHNEGKTTILFIRKAESPNEPYYTVEIKGKEIIQWYGIRDSKPDKEIIGPWLEAYVEHLKNKKKPAELLQAAG